MLWLELATQLWLHIAPPSEGLMCIIVRALPDQPLHMGSKWQIHCACEQLAATPGANQPKLAPGHFTEVAIAAQGPSSPGPGEYDAEMDRKHRPPAYTIGGRPASRFAVLTVLLIAVCLPRVKQAVQYACSPVQSCTGMLGNIALLVHWRARGFWASWFFDSGACSSIAATRSARLSPGLRNQISDLQEPSMHHAIFLSMGSSAAHATALR